MRPRFSTIFSRAMGISAQHFNHFALGISALIGSIGLVVGGAFGLLKFVEFESESLRIELIKSRAGISEQMSIEAQTTLSSDQNTLVSAYGNAGCYYMDTDAPLKQKDICERLRSDIEESSPKIDCQDSSVAILYPIRRILYTVVHKIPFTNHASAQIEISIDRLTISEDVSRNDPAGGPFELNPLRIVHGDAISRYFHDFSIARIGSGYEKNFLASYRIPIEFDCGEAFKTIVFEIDATVRPDIADSIQSSVHMINVCDLTRQAVSFADRNGIIINEIDLSCESDTGKDIVPVGNRPVNPL